MAETSDLTIEHPAVKSSQHCTAKLAKGQFLSEMLIDPVDLDTSFIMVTGIFYPTGFGHRLELIASNRVRFALGDWIEGVEFPAPEDASVKFVVIECYPESVKHFRKAYNISNEYSDIKETQSIGVTKEPRAESVNSEQQGSVSAQAPTERNHAPSDIQRGEISLVEQRVKTEIAHVLWKNLGHEPQESIDFWAGFILARIRPYLRNQEPEMTMHITDMTGKTHSFPVSEPKPVSVSLERCSDALRMTAITGFLSGPDRKRVAKAVLDAAGVKYGE